jgi:thymidine kinase
MEMHVHFGPMFSGKTTALIRAYKQCLQQNDSVICFKPMLDNRYSDDGEIVSHRRSRIPALFVDESNPSELLKKVNGEAIILIDEVQFFDTSIVQIIELLLLQQKKVVVSGLDLDYHRQPFGPTLALVEIANARNGQVKQHFARCDGCSSKAPFSYRKQKQRGQVLVGGAELYGASCDQCYRKLHTV